MKSKEQILSQEKKICDDSYNKKRRKPLVFSFGEDVLFGGTSSDPVAKLLEFSNKWISNPREYLDLKNHSLPEITHSKDKISFPSIITGGEDMVNTYFSSETRQRSNKDSVAIIIPHWNSQRGKYLLSVDIARNLILPISTAVYIPSYLEDDEIDYDIVGPNIGLNLYRFWQDILNLKYLANYLKNDLGFKNIGFISFSIGSPRALLSTIFSDVDINFLVMNFLADDYTEAVMKGMWTREISEAISPHIDYDTLSNIWKPLSPGAYSKYFNRLPKSTRLVQGKYDLVFGLDNAKRAISSLSSFAEIEEGDFGHTAIANVRGGFPVMVRNAKFIRQALGIKLI